MDHSAEDWSPGPGSPRGVGTMVPSRQRSLNPKSFSRRTVEGAGGERSRRSQPRYDHQNERSRLGNESAGLIASPTGTFGGSGGRTDLSRRVPNSESVERMLLENRILKAEILGSIEDLSLRMEKQIEKRKAALKERKKQWELEQRRREFRQQRTELRKLHLRKVVGDVEK